MSTLFDAYYYGVENGEVSGPLPLSAITAKVAQGAIPEWVVLSRNEGGPWAPLAVVKRIGEEAFTPPKQKPELPAKPAAAQPAAKHKPVAQPKPADSNRAKRSRSVAAAYELLAVFIAAMGAVNLGLGVYFAASGEITWLPYAVGFGVCFVSALGLLATAEVLYRLRAIADDMRTIAARNP